MELDISEYVIIHLVWLGGYVSIKLSCFIDILYTLTHVSMQASLITPECYTSFCLLVFISLPFDREMVFCYVQLIETNTLIPREVLRRKKKVRVFTGEFLFSSIFFPQTFATCISKVSEWIKYKILFWQGAAVTLEKSTSLYLELWELGKSLI